MAGKIEVKGSHVKSSASPKEYEVYVQMGLACNGCAYIYVGKHIPSGSFVAIRKVNLENCPVKFDDLAHEIAMHRLFNSPHILECFSTFLSEDTLWVVMPLQGYGSCMDIMQARFQFGLPELAIALILKQVLEALVYLHECGIIHRSLRASHILVSETGQVVISGLRNCYLLERFGLVENKCWHFPTNSDKAINYYSPELLGSLGVVACELANGHTPFANLKSYEILYEKLEGNRPRLLDSSNTSFSNDSEVYHSRTFSTDFHEFAEKCCSYSPDERPTAKELLNHRFFNQTKQISFGQLPKMLEPLTPLTSSVLENHTEMGAVSSVTDQLASATLTDLQWEF
ncbi:STRADA [Bugula neritina]|uniref:STRADA n=1 Tax=Bugula neritina TaxID=10212 RepID=A0A7J7KLT4_BUGNE|nr:STRADA [Bugula neritina]